MNNEIMMLLLSIVSTVYLFSQWKTIKAHSQVIYLLISVTLFLFACICTVAESYVFPVLFNFIEHISYLLSAVSIMLWVKSQYTNIRSTENKQWK